MTVNVDDEIIHSVFDKDEIALIEEYKKEVDAVNFKVAILNAVSVALDKQFWQKANISGVKYGHWVDDGDPSEWTCSECHYRVMRYNNTAFCPNCGADMRGDEWSIDSLMTQHKENDAKAGCEPLKRSDYDPFK